MTGPTNNRLLTRSIESATSAMSGNSEKRAVIYLRVSSAGQMNTDVDRDGFSLPAQRAACARKAGTLGAVVIEEFVERGESGKSTLRRTALTAMLERVDKGDVDFVIVHKVDRLARRRADDSVILERIRAAGAQLVSVSENIDETPSGMLTHGIMAVIAEFYSMNLAAEVLKGTTEKARRGGAPFRAPIGYRNVRETFDGREIRTIAIDEVRGPLIKEAFELYASGEYSLLELASIMEAKGLRTPKTPSRPPGVVAANRLNTILRNPFYVGIVSYRGESHPGRHEALVSEDTFEKVQEMLTAKRQSGERPSRHHHFLRGTLVCADCGGRLFYTKNRGNGGVYEYFSCAGRMNGRGCIQPHHRVEAVEVAVERYYENVELSEEKQAIILAEFERYCDARAAVDAPKLIEATSAAASLKDQEKKLLAAHYADEISKDIFSEEQERIRRERAAARRTIEELSVDDEALREVVKQAVALTDQMQLAYLLSNATEKRLFNQSFFEWIAIDNEKVSGAKLTAPFQALLSAKVTAGFDRTEVGEVFEERRPEGAIIGGAKKETDDPLSKVVGFDFNKMVELAGLEPATSCMPCRRSPN